MIDEGAGKVIAKPVVPVSVVIPCFRCTQTVERAVRSIWSQTHLPAEVILVDDHSSDDTFEALLMLRERYHRNWIVVLQTDSNGGPGSARNIGWDAASQSYVAFLDSDDTWNPKKIEIQYGWMALHPDVALTGHAVQIGDVGALNFDAVTVSGFQSISKIALAISNPFPTPTVMLRRDVPLRFVEGKRRGEDFLLWLEIRFSGAQCYRSNACLAQLHKPAFGAGGLSADLWKMELGELDTYRRLYRLGRVGAISLLSLVAWSLLKYLRRLWVVSIAKSR